MAERLAVRRCLGAALAAGVLLVPAGARAAEALDEARALDLYLDSSPAVRAVTMAVEEAEAGVVGAGVWANPTVVVDREQVFTPGGPTEQQRLGFQAPLSVTGARSLRLDVAEAGVTVAAARARQSTFTLALAFRAAFAEAAAAEARGAIFQAQDVMARRMARIVEVRRRLGESAGADAARMSLFASGVAAKLTGERATADAARGRLAGLLGRPLLGTLRPAEIPVPPSEGALLAHGLGARPDILVLEAERRAALFSGALAWRRQWPEPQLAAGVKQVNEPTVQGLGYTAGLAWPMPLFDRAQGDQAQARAALASAEARLAAVRAGLLAEVPASRAALVARLAARDRFVRDALPRVPGLISAAETAYREGASTLEVLLGAAEAANDARLTAIALEAAARTAQHDLERLVGAPLTAIGRDTP